MIETGSIEIPCPRWCEDLRNSIFNDERIKNVHDTLIETFSERNVKTDLTTGFTALYISVVSEYLTCRKALGSDEPCLKSIVVALDCMITIVKRALEKLSELPDSRINGAQTNGG